MRICWLRGSRRLPSTTSCGSGSSPKLLLWRRAPLQKGMPTLSPMTSSTKNQELRPWLLLSLRLLCSRWHRPSELSANVQQQWDFHFVELKVCDLLSFRDHLQHLQCTPRFSTFAARNTLTCRAPQCTACVLKPEGGLHYPCEFKLGCQGLNSLFLRKRAEQLQVVRPWAMLPSQKFPRTPSSVARPRWAQR